MSSATRVNMAGAQAAIRSPEVVHQSEAPTMGLSDRQVELDHLWRFYRCAVYDGRKVDWNGKEVLGKIEHEIVATSGFMPPGFYDAGQTLPLKFRKPTAPFALARVIVSRFTSLLFSSKRHPKISCSDPAVEDWLSAFAETTRLWSQMLKARTYGGAMGSVGLGFKIVAGKPTVEVHDPRWCTPEFSDREELTVSKLEKRYQFNEDERDDEGRWQKVWYWYRRVIDETSDSIWPKVKAEIGIEPIWEREANNRVDHRYGFCPIVWVQNLPVDDDVDGDPDCHGVYDLIQAIDILLAQAHRGTVSNCDPTLAISSDAEWSNGAQKGSGNALVLEKGGSVNYLEITGSGPKAAMELAEKLEEKALVVARCYLDINQGGPSRTVNEVERNYSSMIEQADVHREQYGERGVKRLLEMVLRAARTLGKTRTEVDGTGRARIVREVIKLPAKREMDEKTGKLVITERSLSTYDDEDVLELAWPGYFTPTADDAGKAVVAARDARDASLIDDEHAARYVSEFFGVEDVRGMLEKVEAKKAAAQAEFMAGMGGGGVPDQSGEPPKEE